MRRILAATAAGLVVVGSVEVYLGDHIYEFLSLWLEEYSIFWVSVVCVTALPGILVASAIVARMPRQPDDECRCRKCKYILRGMTEPRCPECGEQI